MNYYVDESGNWEELQKERVAFIMTGVAVVDQAAFNTQVVPDLQKIQSDNSLSGHDFHATSLRKAGQFNILSLVHDKICQAIDSGVIAIKALTLEPSKVKRTKKKADEVYVDYASDLLASLMLGDSDPKIYSDMKFKGAHPVAMAQRLLTEKHPIKDNALVALMEMTCLKSTAISDVMSSVIDTLENKLQFGEESQVRRMLNAIHDNDISLLHRYKFVEYWLNKEERDSIREKYRVEIERKLNSIAADLGQTDHVSVPRIEFRSKSRNEYGIFIADFVCNSILNVSRRSARPSDERLCRQCSFIKR